MEFQSKNRLDISDLNKELRVQKAPEKQMDCNVTPKRVMLALSRPGILPSSIIELNTVD